jgi:dihydroneopterin aldolase
MNSLFKTVTGSVSSTIQDDPKVVSIDTAPDFQAIFIEELELDMMIGILEQEKTTKQRVIVDAELQVMPPPNWRGDNIDEVVSYADIIEKIKAVSQSRPFNLVETFAEEIIEACFKNPAVGAMKVKVAKPDIIENAASVGAIISRRK